MVVARRVSIAFAAMCFFLIGPFERSSSAEQAAVVSASPYNDARLKKWAEDFHAERFEAVQASVQVDLASVRPHLFARHVWTQTMAAQGKLVKGWQKGISAKLVTVLGPLPELLRLRMSDQPLAALNLARSIDLMAVKDPFTLSVIGFVAEEASEPQLERAAWQSQTLLFPQIFLSILSLIDESLDAAFLKRLNTHVQENAATLPAPYLEAVRWLQKHGYPNGAANKLHVINQWLRVRPRDAFAQRMAATRYASIKNWRRALDHQEKANGYYPFYQFASSQAEYLIRQERFAEAEEFVDATIHTQRAYQPSQRDRLVEKFQVRALRFAGEFGRARDRLKVSLERWPDDRRLLRQKLHLELAARRANAAIPTAEKLAELKSPTLGDHELIMRVFNGANRHGKAYKYFKTVQKTLPRISTGIYDHADTAFRKLGLKREHLELLERAVKDYPSSLSLLNNLISHQESIGEKEAALRTAQARDARWPRRAAWFAPALYRLTKEIEGPEKAKAFLKRLKERGRTQMAVWSLLDDVATETPGKNEKTHGDHRFTTRGRLAVLKEAETQVLGDARPYTWALARLSDVKRWDDCEAVLRRMESRYDSLAPQGKSQFHFWKSEIVRRRRAAPGENVPDKAFDIAQAQLEKFRKLNGDLTDYYFRLLANRVAFRKLKGGETELAEMISLDPDSLNTGLWESQELSRVGMTGLYRRLQRQPLNGEKIWQTAERHARWGGSNIYALVLMRRLQEVDPDRYKEKSWLSADLKGKFGAHAQSFVDRYGGDTAIGDSERYLQWFDSARQRAYGRQQRFVLDTENFTVRIGEADGSFEEQRDDPRCGKPIWRKRSTGTVRFSWTPNCNIAGIATSDDRFVQLEYNNKSEIVKFRIRTKPTEKIKTLSFIYNEIGKPVSIKLQDVGELKLSYDKDGNIENVDGGETMFVVQAETSSAFRHLLTFAGYAEKKDFPTFDHKDEELDRLESALWTRDPEDWMKAVMSYAQYALRHADRGGPYRSAIRRSLKAIEEANIQNQPFEEGLTFWHKYYGTRFPEGLGKADWETWRRFHAELKKIPDHPVARRLLAKFAASPLQPAPQIFWLPRSYLDNKGYWRNEFARDYAGPLLASDLKGHVVFIRSNGERLVGTSQGLFVRRRGVWLRYIFDEASGELRIALPSDDARASSEVLSIAETAAGMLWLGTANGLIRAGKFGDPVERFESKSDGLPSPRISSLAVLGSKLVVGTSSGAALVGDGGKFDPRPLSKLTERIRFSRAVMRNDKPSVLIGTDRGLFSIGDTSPLKQVADIVVDDAIFTPGTNPRLFVLRGTDLLGTLDGQGSKLHLLAEAGNVVFSKQIYGFSSIQLDRGETAITLLTDRGISIWHDGHFEHKSLPYSETPAAATSLASSGQNAIILSDNGVLFSIERGDTEYFSGRVYDLVSDPRLKATYIARGDRLSAIFHDTKDGEPQQELRIVSGSVRHLALRGDGDLIFNDGAEILVLERGDSSPTLLFKAEPSVKDNDYSKVTSLLAASDGSIWATKGPAVFRWKDGSVTEYNFYKDKKTFPLPNNWLSRVVETIDKRIWVVASDEKHINISGYDQHGGLLELRGDRFVLIDPEKQHSSLPRFLTSYTAVGDDHAIVGTSDGFAVHRGGELALLHERKDTTYLKLRQQLPSLFLGRRGARLGDVWLFPTAGGVVAYRKGLWFHPDRLNWVLPDQHLARYGARTVHAVATDASGRIYAGTDRGLLVFDTGGSDAIEFLISNKLADVAFSTEEENKLRVQRDILLRNLKKTDPRYRQIMRFKRLQEEVDELAMTMSRQGPLATGAEASLDNKATQNEARADETQRKQLQTRLKRKQKRLANMLAVLQREHYQLYQLLALKPVELAALQREIAPEDVVVQFLPTDEKLFIHVISRKYRNVLQVAVEKEELVERIGIVQDLLHEAARELGSRGLKRVVGDAAKNAARKKQALAELHRELHWLYRQLIMPIEKDLASKAHVYFVPVGALAYVPFAALVVGQKSKVRYLVERMAIGQMPSMYLFDLALRHIPSASDQMLIFGDPDGSLPGARAEAKEISTIVADGMEALVRIGDDATSEELGENGGQSRIVHLATHGHLNQEKPEQSYLVMADGKRLDMIEVQLLDLKETDFVFLSACETGVGRRGAEYTTLAHAFAYAGAPSIIATLWKVDDSATLEVSKQFYQAFTVKPLPALAKAQRAMIASSTYSHPAAWSGFVAFGRN